jgi:hypothetical protein
LCTVSKRVELLLDADVVGDCDDEPVGESNRLARARRGG